MLYGRGRNAAALPRRAEFLEQAIQRLGLPLRPRHDCFYLGRRGRLGGMRIGVRPLVSLVGFSMQNMQNGLRIRSFCIFAYGFWAIDS
jgi:hypothetical protein